MWRTKWKLLKLSVVTLFQCQWNKNIKSIIFMKYYFNLGIETETIKFNASTSESELLTCIERLNHDENVDGILVQVYDF